MRETNFKQTELGLIPQDWHILTLGEIGEPVMCKRILKDQTTSSGEIPFFKIGTFGGQPDAFISKSLYEHMRSEYSFPEKGDILISAAGTIGRLVVYDGKPSYFQDSNIVWINHFEEIVINPYLYYYLNEFKWEPETSCTISRLYNATIKAAKLIIPSIEEQKLISNTLSDIDALILDLKKLVEKKRAIKAGAMSQLLSGKLRLPGFSEPWISSTLDETGSLLSNNTLSRDNLTEAGTVGNIHYGDVLIKFGAVLDLDKATIPYIIPELTDKFLKANLAEEGDIIFADTAEDETVGKATELRNVKNRRIVSGLHTFWFRPNKKFASGFLGYAVNSKEFHLQVIPVISGTKVCSISKPNLLNFTFSYPSDMEEQKALAKVLTDMDDEIAALEAKLKKYEQLKKGMMQQLLTGKIRLVSPNESLS